MWTTLSSMSSMQERTRRADRFWWDATRPNGVGDHVLKAVIFDLDALTDVECGGHRLAFNAAFAAHGVGVQWSVPRYRKLLALSDERQRVAAELRARGIGTECDVLVKLLVDEICTTKDMVVDETMLDADLAPRAGLVDLITDAFSAGVAVAVVSSGRRQWVEPLLRQLVGDGLVQAIVTADDVVKPQPSRDSYRLALADLGVQARDCLAFNGSPAGVRSAAAVGLAGVLVDPDVAGARADYDGLLVAECSRLQNRAWSTGNGSAAA